jgi:putative DNA primase/helicase
MAMSRVSRATGRLLAAVGALSEGGEKGVLIMNHPPFSADQATSDNSTETATGKHGPLKVSASSAGSPSAYSSELVEGADGLARMLARTYRFRNSTWSPHVWKTGHRKRELWESSAGVAVDVDFKDAAALGAAVPGEVFEVVKRAAEGELLSANLIHATPRGLRLIYVFYEQCTDSSSWLAACEGALILVGRDLGALCVPQHVPGTPGLAVDLSASRDLGRCFFVPNGPCDKFEKGPLHERSAQIITSRTTPWAAAGLAEIVPPALTPAPVACVSLVEVDLDSEFRSAAKMWCADHPPADPYPAATGKVPCPVCGSSGGFHSLPGSHTQWACFGDKHGASGVGTFTGNCYVGDELDLEAFRRRTTPAVVLREDGYLMRGGAPLVEQQPRAVSEEKQVSSLADTGNAERFVARYGGTVRFVESSNHWLVWDARRWAAAQKGEPTQLAIATAKSITNEIHDAATVDLKRAFLLHAIRSQRNERLVAMLRLARTYAPIAARAGEFDADPNLLNVLNGTIDLRTGAVRPQARGDLLTKLVQFPIAERESDLWAAFLARIIPDPVVREFVQRAVGYSLTGSVEEQCLFFCLGKGANGKTLFLETVRDLLGEGEYARAAAPTLLLANPQQSHPVDIAVLQGARFVTTSELPEGVKWDEARIKWLTGDDVLTARHLYGQPFSFRPSHKIWIAANHRPSVLGTDDGIWRRFRIIPFTVTIPEDERDPKLREKLRCELPGVLRWAVNGCVAWRQHGLNPPAAVLAAVREYRSKEDVVASFVQECCAEVPNGQVTTAALFDEYKEWSAKAGERLVTKRSFSDALEQRGFDRWHTSSARGFKGLTLRTG